MNDDDRIEAVFVAIIEADRARGGSWYPSHEMARIAIRRWRSFSRRNDSKGPTVDQRSADLAKGLKTHFDKDNHDSETVYLWLASEMLKAVGPNP
jgi:hypothetical protein